jgi:hypothetical protein
VFIENCTAKPIDFSKLAKNQEIRTSYILKTKAAVQINVLALVSYLPVSSQGAAWEPRASVSTQENR